MIDTGGNNDENSTTTTHCTAALPGQVFQDIYICRACCQVDGSDNDTETPASLACICQACAETCHAHCRLADDDGQVDENDDAVDYVGVGPARCDCHILVAVQNGSKSTCACQLYRASCAFAQQQNLLSQWDASCTLPPDNLHRAESSPVQVFDIPTLQQSTSQAQKIISQVLLLVEHSKDTFWLDASQSPRDDTIKSQWCLLERMAFEILQFHSRNDGVSYRGCEWWVQVKPTSSNDANTMECSANTLAAAAIDMHFDKDEDLAESFGLGVFPTKATVTYLTTGHKAAPTLIFPHTYHDRANNTPLSHVYASRPLQGKHLVFDGSLLHGAIPLTQSESISDEDSLRITFLVNLWKNHQPMGIHPLPCSIRRALRDKLTLDTSDDVSFGIMNARDDDTGIPTLRARSREWMSLPFVQDGMIVKTVVLTDIIEAHANDVVLIEYEDNLEARLDFPEENDDDESTEKDEATGDE